MLYLHVRENGSWEYGGSSCNDELYATCPYCFDEAILGTMFFCYACAAKVHQKCIDMVELTSKKKIAWVCKACQEAD